MICAFIASVRGVFGVGPVCRALTAHGIGISPRTYHDRRVRPASRRTVRDAWLTGLLAGLLLFGPFLVWAVVDLLSMGRRVEQPLRTAPPGRFNDLIAVVAGLAVYAVFLLWLHPWLFGGSPLV